MPFSDQPAQIPVTFLPRDTTPPAGRLRVTLGMTFKALLAHLVSIQGETARDNCTPVTHRGRGSSLRAELTLTGAVSLGRTRLSRCHPCCPPGPTWALTTGPGLVP